MDHRGPVTCSEDLRQQSEEGGTVWRPRASLWCRPQPFWLSERGKVKLAQRAAALRRSRPQEVDRYVGARIRERRILLGLTQQQMADLIGVTYQQAHKYEKGINRVAAGRLYSIGRALGVEVSYFYEGLQTGGGLVPSPSQRMLLDLARNFLNIPDPRHREAVAALARALAESENGDDRAA